MLFQNKVAYTDGKHPGASHSVLSSPLPTESMTKSSSRGPQYSKNSQLDSKCDLIGICRAHGLTTWVAGNQLQKALCLEIITNLVDSIGGQAPGRPQLWEIDSQVLRNKGDTAIDKNVLMYFYPFGFTVESAHL